ncbi:transposase, partial [Streptomyces sp. NPDC001142]
SGLGKVRWVVERAFAWLHQFKRLRIRYERRAALWTGWAGPDTTALHSLTLSTLTWGSHAR